MDLCGLSTGLQLWEQWSALTHPGIFKVFSDWNFRAESSSPGGGWGYFLKLLHTERLVNMILLCSCTEFKPISHGSLGLKGVICYKLHRVDQPLSKLCHSFFKISLKILDCSFKGHIFEGYIFTLFGHVPLLTLPPTANYL